MAPFYWERLMKKLILAVMMVLATAATAQDVKVYTLNVTQAELGIIAAALQARPYSEVSTLLAKLDSQLKEQVKPADQK
jgi:hypothetical protein